MKSILPLVTLLAVGCASAAPTPAQANPAESSDGRDTAAVIAGTVNRHRGKVQACYEQQLENNPPSKVDLLLALEIAPAGEVLSAEIKNEIGSSPVMRDCLLNLARGWIFPIQEEEAITVEYPFVFTPVP